MNQLIPWLMGAYFLTLLFVTNTPLLVDKSVAVTAIASGAYVIVALARR